MKMILLISIMMTALTVLSCTSIPVSAPQETEKGSYIDPVELPKAPVPTIAEIVSKHPGCYNFSFANRGKAPIGFIKGLSHAYARSVCRYRSPPATPAGIMGKTLGTSDKDAFAHYGINASSGLDRLRKNYTLLIGLGMRESSGNYGEGRDASATNTSAETAETGLFQFSYNMHRVSPMLDVLYKEYQANEQNCLKDVYKEGVKKAFNNNYSGSGPGLVFQKFARHCPSFSTEYTAVGIRVLKNHWGPLKRKEAQFVPACETMLEEIEAGTVCQ